MHIKEVPNLSILLKKSILLRKQKTSTKGNQFMVVILLLKHRKKAILTLLTDLLKVFDFLSCDQLIANLHSYGLSFTSLRLLSGYQIANNE